MGPGTSHNELAVAALAGFVMLSKCCHHCVKPCYGTSATACCPSSSWYVWLWFTGTEWKKVHRFCLLGCDKIILGMLSWLGLRISFTGELWMDSLRMTHMLLGELVMQNMIFRFSLSPFPARNKVVI